jgi:ubiquinone/menaquinone biosynthesis C-methylase UbiE
VRRQTHHSADDYAQIAEFYDLEHDLFTDDLPMYRQVVDMVGDPVIELACGSGRILAALVEPGRRLTGVDQSHVMLERCRERMERLNDPATLIKANMADVELDQGTYGVAIIGLNSLMHATSSALVASVLANAYQALDPRGLLVIDLPNPHVQFGDGSDSGIRHEGTSRTVTGESISKFSSQRIDLGDQIVESTIWYDVVDATGALTRHLSEMTLRFLYKSELEQQLLRAGYPEVQFYGTYELDPFSGTSPRLIAFAERS